MVDREKLVWVVLVVVLLLGGLLVGRALEPASGVRDQGVLELPNVRAWLWERRTVDLLAQACLVLAGAFGVAAVLPGQDEEAVDVKRAR